MAKAQKKLNKGDTIVERLKQTSEQYGGRLVHKRRWLLEDCLGRNNLVKTFLVSDSTRRCVMKVSPLDSPKQQL